MKYKPWSCWALEEARRRAIAEVEYMWQPCEKDCTKHYFCRLDNEKDRK